MPFKIVRNDITKMNTDAIVNTANDHPTVGSGCDSAVYEAAGYDKLLEYRINYIGFVPEGDAFITPGFELQAKYIIHAVSPYYIDGQQGEEEKLRSCYRKSLQLAKEYGIRSIAFPLISTGGFGYPKEEGMRIAVDEIHAFLLNNDMNIFLTVFDTKATMLGERLYPDLEAYIDHNYVKEARQKEYGDKFLGSIAPAPSNNDARKEANSGLGIGIRRTRRRHFDEEDSVDPSAKRFGEQIKECSPAPDLSFKPMAASKDSCAEEDFDFEEKHESRLNERMKHLSDTFSEYLLYMIQDKGMENAEVWKRAIIDKKIFSKIKTNPNYHPQKLTALCLCVGARLNLDESKDLLARAGYALSPCDKTDIIFSYFIENEIYDMIELDIQLEEHGCPCIIS